MLTAVLFRRFLPYIAIAGALLTLIIGGAGGYRYAAGRCAEEKVTAIEAEAQRRGQAFIDLAQANMVNRVRADRAEEALEAVRTQQPKTLIKTVVKRVEVPREATSVECPVPTLGDEFTRLYNAAADAYSALSAPD